MSYLLQAFGVFFILIILAIVIAFFWIRSKIRAFLKAAAAGLTPPRIHCMRVLDHAWSNGRSVAKLVDPLLALGFEDAGAFKIDELPQVAVQFLVNKNARVYGAIYEHDDAGVWLDLVQRFQEGGGSTYTTSPRAGVLDRREGSVLVKAPEADPRTLHERLVAESPAVEGRTPKPIASPADVVSEFERAWAEEMDWRAARGGPTEREIRAVAAASGEEHSDEAIAATRALLADRARNDLDVGVLEKLAATGGTARVAVDELREHIVVVHDQLTPGEALARFNERLDDPVEPGELAPTARAAFAGLNAALQATLQYRKLGDVSEPVGADVYVAPESARRASRS